MTVSQNLFELTRQANEQAGSSFAMLDLAEHHDYSIFLASHYLAYSVLEPAFASLPEAMRPPVMTGLLANDLAALGINVPSVIPDYFDSDAIGAAYVIAGSNFDRRTLLKRWSRSNDPVVASAGSYLGSHALVEYAPIIHAFIENIEDEKRVSQGVYEAFRLFERCLDHIKSAYWPFHSGGRFDRNASIPSRKSSLI